MTIRVERKDRVAFVRINRPEALNALNLETLRALLEAVRGLDSDPGVGALVLAGTPKAFAAGADIKEMEARNSVENYLDDFAGAWEDFASLRTPIIAAVSGFALGGGCEVAMMCDIIIAADTARFGQPEITLGIIPGMGGTQRMARLVGRARAMDLILTGRIIDAKEALAIGLVSRLVPADELEAEAESVAKTVAGFGKMSTMMAKEAIKRADEVSLREGLLFERRLFHALFASHDQKEGMRAFIEKRKPKFTGR